MNEQLNNLEVLLLVDILLHAGLYMYFIFKTIVGILYVWYKEK